MRKKKDKYCFPKKCCLCGDPIDIQPGGWADGHNALPVGKGRCCTLCNETKVIPTRIRRIYTMRREADDVKG